MRILLSILLILLPVWPVMAETLYVDGLAGDDTANTGRQTGDAFATVGYAASTASASDVIWVNQSTYPELVTIVDANTTWLGDTQGVMWGGTGRPIVTGSDARNNAFTWGAVANVSLTGFACYSAKSYTINCTSASGSGSVVDCEILDGHSGVYSNGAVDVMDSTIKNMTYYGIFNVIGADVIGNTVTTTGYDGITGRGASPVIEGNALTGCGGGTGYASIYLYLAVSGTVKQNTVLSAPGNAIVVNNSSLPVIDSNLVVSAARAGLVLATQQNQVNRIRNNYFYDCGTGTPTGVIVFNEQTTGSNVFNFSNNIYYNNTGVTY